MDKTLKQIKKLLEEEGPLKARAIARKLGFDRSDVSALMHKHKDVEFHQNENFEWVLMPEEIVVKFDNCWVTCFLFEEALSIEIEDIHTIDKIRFVVPENCKFMLEAIARFLALCNQLVLSKKEVTIDLSSNNSSKAYWNRAGFFDHLSDKVNVLPKRPKISSAKTYKGKSGNLVEFGEVDPETDNKKLVRHLTDTFISLSSDNYEDPAFTILSELIGNIKEHSGSSLKGFAALQRYKGKTKSSPPHIQTTVSDNGVGIATTLRPVLKKFYPKLLELSDIELVKKAMSEGRITRFGTKSGHGLGFKSSKEKALKFNAKYSVRQNNFSLEFIFKNGELLPVKMLPNLVEISGTHICFDFDIDASDST